MFDLFGWLRRKAREAVVGGVEDALLVLAPAGEEPVADLDELRNRLALAASPKQLPPAVGDEDEEPKKRKGK